MSAARDRLNTGARVSGLWAVVRRWLSDLRAAAPRDLRHCRVRRTGSTGPGLARRGSRIHCRGQRRASSPSCLGGTPARSLARGPSSCLWAARTPRDRRIALLGGNRGSALPVAEWNGREPTFLVSNRSRPAPTADHQPTTRCGQGPGELSASDSACSEPRSTAGEDVSPGASGCRRGEVRGESVSDRYPDHPSRRHVGRGPMENGELERTACVRLGSTRPAPEDHPRGVITIEAAFGPTPSAAAILARIRSRDVKRSMGLRRAVSLAGFPGWQIDGRMVGPSGHLFTPFSPRSRRVTPPDSYALDSGERFRLIVLDVRGTRVVLFLESAKLPAKEFPAFLATANRILGSLEFPG